MWSGRWADGVAALLAFGTSGCLFVSGLAGCAGSAKPNGENHACFRALDCNEGLVCVEGRCTADVGPIVPEGSGQPAPAAAMTLTSGNPDAGP